MKLRKILTLATAGTAAASLSLFGLGLTPAYADADQPITFEVEGGFLVINQTATSSLLIEATAVNMPSTAVTDGRSDVTRSGEWTVTATASNLVSDEGGLDEATILSTQITLNETPGSFSPGSGTRVDAIAVVGTGTLVSATADTIDSVYTYVPTATLAAQTLPFAGSYSGNVVQTVV
jgi:hypothetical protein